MRKYEAIYKAPSVAIMLILGAYMGLTYAQPPHVMTIWNTLIPLIGGLTLFALTLVTSELVQEETAQADAYVADSEYAEIDDDGEVVV